MSADDDHGGIPTRAIHEAYLDMQRALKRHRQATDRGDDAAVDAAHGDVQETVLTLYELLRPHLKHNTAVDDYWEGDLPTYPGDGRPPDPEDGKGVIQVQTRTDTYPLDAETLQEIGDSPGLGEWHDALGLNGKVQVAAVQPQQNGSGEYYAIAQLQTYQIGLRTLDDWRTRYQTVQTTMDGFMGGVQTTEKVRQRVGIDKLRRASRELSDVAERLGALSEFDASTPRTEITDELIEEVDQWRKQQIE